MVKAEILYANLDHPSVGSKLNKKMYEQIHLVQPRLLVMPIGYYRKHYNKLPLKEDINTNLPIMPQLEKLFHKYNADSNPYDYYNTPGQDALKQIGVRHTSMSIGDIIKVGKNRYIVLSRGFGNVVLKW